jgi:membrane protein YdbS with pleckstrin-like domain
MGGVIVLIFLLVLAAIAGVLGLVLKITLVVVLTLILTMLTLAAIAYLGIRHQWKRFQREVDAGSTTIEVGRPIRSDGDQQLPGGRDDRY